MYGDGACKFSYDEVHGYLIEYLNMDAFQFCGGVEIPMLVHFGDVLRAREALEKTAGSLRRAWENCRQSGNWAPEFGSFFFGTPAISMLIYVTGMPAGSYYAVLQEYLLRATLV